MCCCCCFKLISVLFKLNFSLHNSICFSLSSVVIQTYFNINVLPSNNKNIFFFFSFLFVFNNYLTINYKVFNNKVKKVRVLIRASSLNIYHSTSGVCIFERKFQRKKIVIINSPTVPISQLVNCEIGYRKCSRRECFPQS